MKNAPALHTVEMISLYLSRTRCATGWLYVNERGGIAFVPDPSEPVETDFRHKLTKKQVAARRKNVEKAREALAETRSKSDKINKARR